MGMVAFLIRIDREPLCISATQEHMLAFFASYLHSMNAIVTVNIRNPNYIVTVVF